MDRISIRKLNEQINILKEKFNKELDTVNHYYWPIVAKLNRNKKNHVWYFTLACCLLGGVLMWIFLGEIVNEYWLGASLGGCAVVLFLTGRRMVKTNKQLKKEHETWEKALKTANDLQEEIKVKSEENTKNMIAELSTHGVDINEIGNAYDDVLEYYNQWVENN